MTRDLTIEVLYPEVANLHGDSFNMTYLEQCRPDARVIHSRLTDKPAFATTNVDLIYLGPMTEKSQLKVTERLKPHRERIEELIAAGTTFLFTHNAFEVLGARIRNDEMGYDVPALGIFDFESTLSMFGRYNGKVTGVVAEAGPRHPIVGYKSQFSMVTGGENLDGFISASRGIGRNRSTAVEGVRVNNFIGTSLLGPLLVTNPYFTKGLLSLIDPDSEPVLAHEELAIAAYDSRLAHFSEDRRWHESEKIVSSR